MRDVTRYHLIVELPLPTVVIRFEALEPSPEEVAELARLAAQLYLATRAEANAA